MRKFIVFLLLLACISPFACGQESRSGQPLPKAKPGTHYPIKVRISAIHIRSYCASVGYHAACYEVGYAETIIDGSKIEVMGAWDDFPASSQLSQSLADYSARIVKEAPQKNVAPIGRKYELLFPGGFTWRCSVTGVSE